MVKKVEIRIHVNAPTTRYDDDNYRAQAESWAHFQGQRMDIMAGEGASDTVVPPDVQAVSGHSIDQAKQDSTTTYLDDTQLAWTAIESQLWPGSSPAPINTLIPPRSTLPADSPVRVIVRKTPSQDNRISQRSSDTDCTRSSYLRSPELEKSGKRRRIDHEASVGLNLDRSRAHPFALYAALPENKGSSAARIGKISTRRLDGSVERAPTGPGQASEETVVSELPTTYSLSDVTSPDSLTRHSNSGSGSKGPSSNTNKVAADPNSIVQPPSNAHPMKAAPSANDNPFKQFTKSFKRSSQTNVRDFAEESLSSQLQELSTFSTQLFPPQPTTSCEPEMGTNVTKALQTLADHEINSHYKPLSQLRELRPLERGAWVIDTLPWPLEGQITFWKYLTRVVGNGSLGWGIWASRDRGPKGELGVVRIFCWGEVIRHVYLVLYAASESKVRKLGLKWVDAEGEEIVLMPGADSR